MTTQVRSALRALETGGDVMENGEAWFAALRASGKSPATIKTYSASVKSMDTFLRSKGMPRNVEHLKREHVQAFIESLLSPPKNSTASVRDRALRRFFKWLLAEGMIESDPMANMDRIKVGDFIKDVYDDEELRRMTGHIANDGSFLGVRDLALVRLLVTLGVRASELSDLALDREGYEALLKRKTGAKPSGFVDWDGGGIALLKTKGRTARVLKVTPRAWRTLKKYLSVRMERKLANSDWLWLSSSGRRITADPGRMTYAGLFQAMKRRCRAARVEFRGLHSFRHTYVSGSLAQGVTGQTIALRAGWSEKSSSQMLARYSRARAEEIANDEAMAAGFGDDY